MSELTTHWAKHGFHPQEMFEEIIGSSGDEAVDKLITTILFATAFQTKETAAFVFKGKMEIAESVLQGNYPPEVKEYAYKALEYIAQQENLPSGQFMRDLQNKNMTSKELIQKYGFERIYDIKEEGPIEHGTFIKLEKDLINRMSEDNPEACSILAPKDIKSLDQLRAELVRRYGEGRVAQIKYLDEEGKETPMLYVSGIGPKVGSELAKLYEIESFITNEGLHYVSERFGIVKMSFISY